MANFGPAFSKLLLAEGAGFTNYAEDGGGPTKYGITLETLTEYKGRPTSSLDVQNLTVNDAQAIYQELYWDKLQLTLATSDLIAYTLFNQAVNCGAVTVAKRMQGLLNSLGYAVTPDGVFGPMSVNALNEAWAEDSDGLFLRFLKVTYVAYANDVVANPSQLRFLVGWVNRANALLDLLN